MKKYLTFIISALILSVGMVGCSDKKLSDEERKIKEDEAVKATLVGYWERTSLEVISYKNGQRVDATIEPDLISVLLGEIYIPRYLEFTQTNLILDPQGVAKKQEYTLDSRQKVIIVTDRDGQDAYETHLKYTLSVDNNTVTVAFTEDNKDEETLSEYDKLEISFKLERRANLPDRWVP